MTDDFSELETGASCYVLNSQTSIYSYKSGVRSSYIQVGGKWFKTSQSSFNTIPSTSVCIPYSSITSISSYNYFYPFYEFFALVLAVFVWFFVWFLFRRLVRWRV